MMIAVTKWDAAEFLKTPERVRAYLDAVLEDGDPELFRLALGDIARSQGMAAIAEETGSNRQSLYRALSPAGNPEFATVAGVLRALGMRLSVTMAAPAVRRTAAVRSPVKRTSGKPTRAVKGTRKPTTAGRKPVKR